MKIKNVRIGTQLKIGFATILFFVILVGAVAFVQTNQLYLQLENMYQHTLQVRRAIGDFNNDISNIRIGMRDLMLSNSEQEKQTAIEQMKVSSVIAEEHFSIIKEKYLGPSSDVEEVYKRYIIWDNAREENIKLILSGQLQEVKENFFDDGSVGIYRSELFASINKIDVLARTKGDSMYFDAGILKESLSRQLTLLIVGILILSMIIIYILLRNIRKPLKEMNDAVLRFHQGDMSARSSYSTENEFGTLSSSFNTLANLIQENTILNEKIANLASAMLSEEGSKKFFQVTLGVLSDFTGSQMAAVYLLSKDGKNFEHFESIGMDHNAKQLFESDSFEGEFGAALLSRKIQYVDNIPDDTRFIFQTVSGKYIPREIITVPILFNNQVIAIISLATISKFSPKSIDLIERSIVAMSARIEGIMAYDRIKEYKEVLEEQNIELTTHKSELSAQTAELMQQNTELEMQKKELDEASRLKTNFLSNMSHELRTPLNSVIALSGVLSRRLANQIQEEEYSYLEIIERNGKNLLMLINDILDISRIESGREEIEITKFSANNIIHEVVTMIQPQAIQKNIELVNETKDFELFIKSDADKCRHILQNLIGNAVKFTEKGNVAIKAQQNINSLEIKIIDSGIGISADNLQHVFDEFRQADGSTSRKFGGTGLGLAIAKKYANMLGGTISVKSTMDVGSEFTLSLPLNYVLENRIVEEEKVDNFKYITQKPLHRTDLSLTNKTILLVDDNESAIIQIKDLIEEMGIRVQVAHDATEAFAIIDKVIPDAIMLDLMMPDIDGFRMLEIMRNAEPTAHVPVLIMTAKHITKEELKFLRRNNIHQLIQKGDVNRINLQTSVFNILYPEDVEVKEVQKVSLPIGSKPVVLVVEDNPDNMITVKALINDHYNVLEAIDGKEAIEMAKKYVPNLILMDIALPNINGIEALKEIRKYPELQHIPVIALTASAMIHDRESILSHGFDAFVGKPIIAKEFFKVLKEVLYGK